MAKKSRINLKWKQNQPWIKQPYILDIYSEYVSKIYSEYDSSVFIILYSILESYRQVLR